MLTANNYIKLILITNIKIFLHLEIYKDTNSYLKHELNSNLLNVSCSK